MVLINVMLIGFSFRNYYSSFVDCCQIFFNSTKNTKIFHGHILFADFEESQHQQQQQQQQQHQINNSVISNNLSHIIFKLIVSNVILG